MLTPNDPYASGDSRRPQVQFGSTIERMGGKTFRATGLEGYRNLPTHPKSSAFRRRSNVDYFRPLGTHMSYYLSYMHPHACLTSHAKTSKTLDFEVN